MATISLVTAFVVGTFPLLANLAGCYQAILNDARIISLDPALESNFEILYAYPGFWALFWYRLSHALLQQDIPLVSSILPRLVMSIVRYATAIDIHPGAQISGEGILIDHGTGLVVGATAVIGGGVTLYHGVTLGNSGKKVPPGTKRHPTIGDRVVIGAGAKVLGDIVIGDDVLVGANSVVTKPVPKNHTAVGVPARVLCHGSATGKDVAGAAICELHKRLQKVEKESVDQKQQDKKGGQESENAEIEATTAGTAVRVLQDNEPSAQRPGGQTAGEGREQSSLPKPSMVVVVEASSRSASPRRDDRSAHGKPAEISAAEAAVASTTATPVASASTSMSLHAPAKSVAATSTDSLLAANADKQSVIAIAVDKLPAGFVLEKRSAAYYSPSSHKKELSASGGVKQGEAGERNGEVAESGVEQILYSLRVLEE